MRSVCGLVDCPCRFRLTVPTFAYPQATIAQKTDELGGVHKYDLTPDVTHLIVGEYDTPKYRHVAKERPDIKAMAMGWVDAVRDLWIKDEQIDFRALEQEWCLKAFETGGGALDDNLEVGPKTTLNCCLTGFDDRVLLPRLVWHPWLAYRG